jgi:hypothetical protein
MTINRAKKSMYWDARGNIFKIFKNSLQEFWPLNSYSSSQEIPCNITQKFITVASEAAIEPDPESVQSS